MMGEGGRGLTIIGIVGLHPWMEGDIYAKISNTKQISMLENMFWD